MEPNSPSPDTRPTMRHILDAIVRARRGARRATRVVIATAHLIGALLHLFRDD